MKHNILSSSKFLYNTRNMQEKMSWLQSHQPVASIFPYELSFLARRFFFGLDFYTLFLFVV